MNTPKHCYLEITLAPGDENSTVSVVPNLLHLTWKTGKRAQDSGGGTEEPVEAHEWRLVLLREGSNIYR